MQQQPISDSAPGHARVSNPCLFPCPNLSPFAHLRGLAVMGIPAVSLFAGSSALSEAGHRLRFSLNFAFSWLVHQGLVTPQYPLLQETPVSGMRVRRGIHRIGPRISCQTSPPVKDTHMQNGHDLTDNQGLKLSCLLWTQRYSIDACGPEAGLQAFRLIHQAACSDIKRIKHTRIEKNSCSQE